MTDTWNEARLQKYIDDEIEESLTLDYKAAASLGKTDGKKKEITKDVSAMANSAGGILIYGMAEHQDKSRKHLPEKLDPVDRAQFSKDWLEHVISNILPKIDGLIIYPVSLSSGPNDVAYVVVIPQSNTAHQATDKRYYKRFNFESVPMDDYEIRDVMGRGQFPKIELDFEILRVLLDEERQDIQPPPTSTTDRVSIGEVSEIAASIGRPKMASPSLGYGSSGESGNVHYSLRVKVTNGGRVYAQYINALIDIPVAIAGQCDEDWITTDGDQEYCRHFEDNMIGKVRGPLPITEGTKLYAPLLPGLSLFWRFPLLSFLDADKAGLKIKWSVYADNAPPAEGEIDVEDIEVVDAKFTTLFKYS
jgi:hypothetical protein